MASITDIYCDVLLTLKNKRVKATKQITLSIPGGLRANGKAQRVKLHVSDEGHRELQKFYEGIMAKAVALGDELEKFKTRPQEEARTTQELTRSGLFSDEDPDDQDDDQGTGQQDGDTQDATGGAEDATAPAADTSDSSDQPWDQAAHGDSPIN